MWWFKFPLLLLLLSLADGQAGTSKTITDVFSLLNSGACAAQTANLNLMLADAITLTNSINEAMTAAQISPRAFGQRGKDGYVARKLFTKYFGIEFENAGKSSTQTPTIDYKNHWAQINAVYNNLYAFLTDGHLQGPGASSGTPTPWLICSSSALVRYGWGVQAVEYDPGSTEVDKLEGIEINGKVITIDDVYEEVPGMDPYFLPEKTYYALLPSKFNGQPCQSAYAMVLEGRDEYRKVVEGKEVKYTATEPGVLICSKMFKSSPLTLSDVTWADPSTEKQIANVEPKASTTLFHELAHLVTWWLGANGFVGDGPDRRQIRVTDITYDTRDILLLAQGQLTISLEPGAPAISFTSYHSTVNAESYTFFAFSWWYYKNVRTSTDSSGKTQSQTPATFYNGYLQLWNVKERTIIDGTEQPS